MCQALADVHSQGMDGDVPVIKMTPFYVNANMNSARKLHPRLKYDHVDMDVEDVLQVITDPFKKYDDLAIIRTLVIQSPDHTRAVGLLQESTDDTATSCG